MERLCYLVTLNGAQKIVLPLIVQQFLTLQTSHLLMDLLWIMTEEILDVPSLWALFMAIGNTVHFFGVHGNHSLNWQVFSSMIYLIALIVKCSTERWPSGLGRMSALHIHLDSIKVQILPQKIISICKFMQIALTKNASISICLHSPIHVLLSA